MTLTEYNAKYEYIIRSNISDRQKALKLADLMTDMEGHLNEAGEHQNKEANALYRKVSLLSNLL
ncbi:hypothetical protein ACWF7H_23040 [Peribacillus butanolivorans]|jgi:hypothetical protein|uniref:IDEAL domain-containing protein n=1 Tax=Peribacillus butanolivorans TaxID=421767 RepID=A0AAX0RRG1_9BACI|nr:MULTISPECIES: hypothetical protein [Peribacillus]KQU17884.1 hypothetical protein ASG65_25925 [Bacillus sp. Leaf13]AXN39647.1 hypothetical protein DTO10_15575 [Peribacillus butanolivorans]KON67698.1 hypothetical protein AKG34_01825 [Peribacillus butanolivorans]MBK5444942.1 hypothetical protein [Peribacillus sp. TH24]MBK5460339.1 hypothetical protein [Peribacillus sp. TH27]